MAFQIIDSENVDAVPSEAVAGEMTVSNGKEPIYENVEDEKEPEPHYQVPRSREPYYESPKKAVPIPLYENVELMFPASSDSSRFSMAESNESFGVDDGTEMVFPIDQSKYLIMEPPKEKPPPLPIQEQLEQADNFKRINSTKRIKKEIRNKRSSFLGIEGQDFDDYSLELSVAPPPDMQALLQEEKRLEKQLYQKVGLYENSDNGELMDFVRFQLELILKALLVLKNKTGTVENETKELSKQIQFSAFVVRVEALLAFFFLSFANILAGTFLAGTFIKLS